MIISSHPTKIRSKRKRTIIKWIEIVIGFASGVMIGSVFISLLIVLGVVQRFVYIAKRKEKSDQFTIPLICGVIVGTYLSLTSQSISEGRFLLIVIGLFHGLFNGALIAALAETLNVFPLLSKRFNLRTQLFSLLVALVLGKVIGSLFQWLILAR